MDIWVCLFVFVASEHNSSMSSFQLLTHDALTFLYLNPFLLIFLPCSTGISKFLQASVSLCAGLYVDCDMVARKPVLC